MMTRPLADLLKDLGVATAQSPAPDLQIVLGSGVAPAFTGLENPPEWKSLGEIPFSAVKGLVPATAPGHKGAYRYFRHEPTGRSIAFQVGRLHGYEGHSPQEVVQTVILPKLAGTKKFLLTNASGSLDPTFKVGDLMVIRDHVNLTGRNPLYGPNPVGSEGQLLGPRFPDMSAVYDLSMRKRLETALSTKPHAFSLVHGIYLGLLGPSYETPAEVSLFSKWGLGAVGMSTVWEAIALRHSGAQLAGLSFISNLGCGLSQEPLSQEEVDREAGKVAARLVRGLFDYAAAEISA
jgi:purine-nucleoside phosphorylase